MSDCVRFVPMIGAREGELEAAERSALDAHLAGCAACRAREADVRALGPLLTDALLKEAARRDFAPFVDGVMARVSAQGRGTERVAAGQGRPSLSPRAQDSVGHVGAGGEGRGEGGSWVDRLTTWLDRHRKAALATGIPALAAAALVVYVQTRPGSPAPEVAALMELTSEGEVSMVLQTSDGPIVLLGEENT